MYQRECLPRPKADVQIRHKIVGNPELTHLNMSIADSGVIEAWKIFGPFLTHCDRYTTSRTDYDPAIWRCTTPDLPPRSTLAGIPVASPQP